MAKLTKLDLANELDAYVEDYAKTAAARIVKEGADHD